MSEPFLASDVARFTGGVLVQGNPATEITNVAIDSRTVVAGTLFVAIVGPNHDAHRFLLDVARAGAAALLVAADHTLPKEIPATLPVVAVADTTVALGALAREHRARFRGPLLAITGSSGKTTTKEMCASILEAAGPCLSTQGNLNNEFGVPLTLLRRESTHQRAVIELGMNHRGEIAALAAISRPTVALVTNVGVAHIEFLGSREEIAREKGDLYAALDASGVAIANLDDELAAAQAERSPGRVVGYSRTGNGDVHVEGEPAFEGGTYSFRLVTPEGRAEINVTGLGDTTVQNALAAAAASMAAGASLADVVRGLSAYRPPSGRMAPYPLAVGATLIDDSYNANPDSMHASLRALAQVSQEGRAIAVLGDMGELGEKGAALHRETGRQVAALGIHELYALGTFASTIVAGARDAGLNEEHAHEAESHEQISEELMQMLAPKDWVLVKGSRAMRMERIADALRIVQRSH